MQQEVNLLLEIPSKVKHALDARASVWLGLGLLLLLLIVYSLQILQSNTSNNEMLSVQTQRNTVQKKLLTLSTINFSMPSLRLQTKDYHHNTYAVVLCLLL